MEISFTRCGCWLPRSSLLVYDQNHNPPKPTLPKLLFRRQNHGYLLACQHPGHIDAKTQRLTRKSKIQTQLDADDQLLTYKKDSALMRFNDCKFIAAAGKEVMADIVTTSLRIGAEDRWRDGYW